MELKVVIITPETLQNPPTAISDLKIFWGTNPQVPATCPMGRIVASSKSAGDAKCDAVMKLSVFGTWTDTHTQGKTYTSLLRRL